MKRVPDPEGDDNEGGGLSPSALVIHLSPDMLPRWRLQKSVALDNAEWAMKVGRKDIASMHVLGARLAHLQILRIKAHLRRRANPRATDLERINQRITELQNAALETAPLGARAHGASPPGQREARDADRAGLGAQPQDGVDVSLARDDEAATSGGLDGCDSRAPGSGVGAGDISAELTHGKRRRCKHASGLSPRELAIAKALGSSLSNSAIAARLQISVNNVSAYIYFARKKLGLADRNALAEWARTSLSEPKTAA